MQKYVQHYVFKVLLGWNLFNTHKNIGGTEDQTDISDDYARQLAFEHMSACL